MSDPDPIDISIIIPCFNQGEFILDAIASVEDCLIPYELIIVNDGSTEMLTQQILTYLKQNHYGVIDQENQGLAAARNAGIAHAKGRYILPLDADNKIRPDYIPKAIAILEQYPQVGVVYGNAELFGDEHGIWEPPDFDFNELVKENYIDACAVFRRAVWQDCNGYDPHMPDHLGLEDWDFWLSAAGKGWQFYHIPEVLFDYRDRPNSMAKTCTQPENYERVSNYIYQKHSAQILHQSRKKPRTQVLG